VNLFFSNQSYSARTIFCLFLISCTLVLRWICCRNTVTCWGCKSISLDAKY